MQLKVAVAALNQSPLDVSGNYERISSCLSRARREAVDVLCFPELSISGYGCEDLFLTRDLLQKSWTQLLKLAEEGSGLFFVVGLPLLHKERTYNVLAVVDDAQIVGFYAKQHLARTGVYYEPRWFEAWPSGVIDTFSRDHLSCPIGEQVHEYMGQRIGFEICEDIWQSDRPARRYAAQGVDIILSAHASHFALGKYAERIALVEQSAEQFNCLYAYVNMLGNDSGRLVYDGDLLIADRGTVVATAPRLSFSSTTWLTYEWSRPKVPRPTEVRPDLFTSEEEEFTQAASLALFDYLRRSRAHGYVVSASGGADSSICAVLVREMLRRAEQDLGREGLKEALPFLNTEPGAPHLAWQVLKMVYQRSANSSKETHSAARSLAQALDAHFIEWSIEEEVQLYTQKVTKALGRTLNWGADDLALQNIQARARTPGLWLLANVLNALLLTTSNRSEGSVGYATMDGDTAGSLAPLASVSKVFILKWLQWAEQQLPCPGLRAVNNLQPTAELRPPGASQSDEADLMPYAILLAIEREAIYHRKGPQEVLNSLSEQKIATQKELRTYVKKFFQLWIRNQWKRERLAPSFHLDAYSVDPKSWYRFPILSGGYEEELNQL